MKKALTVCWISAGVSSFIAAWFMKDLIDEFIYIDIDDQHPDSIRFIHDCEKALGKRIQILRSQYGCVENVVKAMHYINSPYGAPCTNVLKKRVRKKWEDEHQDFDITYVWGMDSTERHRADRLEETMTHFKHIFPLIERNLTKQDCHAILNRMGIRRPKMYDLGYPNNNCIGCVKGGWGIGTKSEKTSRMCSRIEPNWNG